MILSLTLFHANIGYLSIAARIIGGCLITDELRMLAKRDNMTVSAVTSLGEFAYGKSH